jgi:hypothetical protein
MKINNKYEILTPDNIWCDFVGVQKNKKDILYKIKCGSDCITATSGHVFFINDNEIKVENLQVGDVIDGCKNKIDIIEIDREDNTYDIIGVKNNKHKFIVNGKFHTRNCDEYAFVPKSVADDFWASNYPTISASTESKIVIISCVTKDTYVYTDKGIKQLSDFIIEDKKGGYIVNDYSILGRDKLRLGNLIVNSGKTKTRKIHTSVSTLEGSLNHKLWSCKNGKYDWYKLSELSIGDYVQVQYGMNVWGNNDNGLTPEMAYLLGMFIMKGKNSSIKTSHDFGKIFKNLNINYDKCIVNSINRYYYYFNNLPDIFKRSDLNHNIPKDLMEMPRENIIAMLRGILDVSCYFNRGNVIIESKSREFLEKLNLLFINLGLTSSIFDYYGSYRMQFRRDNSLLIHDIIGFNVEYKRKQRGKLNIVIRGGSGDVIPNANNILNDYLPERYYNESVDRNYLLSIKDKLVINEDIKEFIEDNISENIMWCKIKDITESENEVFDFSLPDVKDDKWCHSVCYNGIIGHQTPNGMYNMFHKLYTDAEANRNTFVPLKFTWKDVPGRTQKWADEQRKNLGKRKFAQEQMVEFLGSTSTVIDSNVLYKLNANIVEPESYSLENSLRVYEKPIKDVQYVLGCDVAKGTGENASCIQVLKIISTLPVKMEQVAMYHNNKIDVYSFADIINRLSIYYNNAYIMCENNAEGSAVVNRLWWDHNNMKLVNDSLKQSSELGIRATTRSKPKAVLLMKKLIEDDELLIKDELTIRELSTFVEEGGKFKGKDTNDDTVSALYWGVYILEMGIIDDIKITTMEGSVDTEAWGILSDVDILDGMDMDMDDDFIKMFMI